MVILTAIYVSATLVLTGCGGDLQSLRDSGTSTQPDLYLNEDTQGRPEPQDDDHSDSNGKIIAAIGVVGLGVGGIAAWKYAKLKKELHQAGEQIHASENTRELLENRIDLLRTELVEAHVRIDRTNTQIADTNSQVAALRNKAREKTRAIESLKTQNVLLNSNLAVQNVTLRNEISELENKLWQEQRRIKTLSNETTALSKKIISIESDIRKRSFRKG